MTGNDQVHDHFDGRSHCVECNGPCKLTGNDRALTEMIRWHFDQMVQRGEKKPWVFVRETLAKIGLDWEQITKRAQETR
jgi:hypothetical protein